MVWQRGILVVLGMLSTATLHPQQPGAAIFAANCAGCHGADGRGGEHAPNIATAPEIQRLADRDLAAIVKNGISGAGMPAFPSLQPRQVKDVVTWLGVLQGRGDISKLPGDPNRGEALFFAQAQCSACHTVNGKGGFIGSELSFYGADAKPDQIRAVILDPEKNLPRNKKATTVVTLAGKKITGMLKVNDNFSVSIQTPDGTFHFFPKSQLAQVDYGSRSLMPASSLNDKDVDDLISYLLQTGNENARQPPDPSSKSDDHDD